MLTHPPEHFANAWLNAWNSHDITQILAHYADDIAFTSPFVVALLDKPNGTLHGKAALRDYFLQGLAKYPDLAFELLDVAAGVGSVTVVYNSVNNLLAVEVMELDKDGLVRRVLAHYGSKRNPKPIQ